MSLSRSLSLAGSFAGAVCNLAFALRLLALSRSLGWESESEWESSIDVWAVDSVRLVWGLLFAYFAAAAASCFIGFIGIAKVCSFIAPRYVLSTGRKLTADFPSFSCRAVHPSAHPSAAHTLVRTHLSRLFHRRLCLCHARNTERELHDVQLAVRAVDGVRRAVPPPGVDAGHGRDGPLARELRTVVRTRGRRRARRDVHPHRRTSELSLSLLRSVRVWAVRV